MKEYHKIQTIFKRDPEIKYKIFWGNKMLTIKLFIVILANLAGVCVLTVVFYSFAKFIRFLVRDWRKRNERY